MSAIANILGFIVINIHSFPVRLFVDEINRLAALMVSRSDIIPPTASFMYHFMECRLSRPAVVRPLLLHVLL